MTLIGASLVAQMVKHLPAIQETQEMWVQSLSGEDSLEDDMAIHSSILAGKIPWTEEPAWLQSMRSQKGWTQLSIHIILYTRNIIIITVLIGIRI